MSEREKLIQRTVTITDKNYQFVAESQGVSFSDKLRRLLDKIEDGDYI
jgi:predicted CopG family antitoxin